MTQVSEMSVGEYLEALGSTAAVPGGGSAAALAGAMGAALLRMVAKLSAKKAKSEADRDILTGLWPELDRLVQDLAELSQKDIDAYRAVIETRRRAGGDDELGHAYERAAEVPLETASLATRGLEIAADISLRAWNVTASDLAAGTELLQTGRDAALANVAVNLPELPAAAASRIERAYRALLDKRPSVPKSR